MKMCHIFISGFVQGVGFRQFIKRSALKLGLTGWVKNLLDNRVEATFCGSKLQIEKIITICKKGPFLADIKSVDVIWEETGEEFKDFKVI